ncbi:glycosyl transferase family 2 [Diplonema papillatum]|nr:glycosyl transferase family 2 [Diplonema papillatum]
MRTTPKVLLALALVVGGLSPWLFSPFLHGKASGSQHPRVGRTDSDTRNEADARLGVARVTRKRWVQLDSTSEERGDEPTASSVWIPVRVNELKKDMMVGIRSYDGRWVARAVDTASSVASEPEKTWQVRFGKKGGVIFKSWAGTHLGLNREPKLNAQSRTVSDDEKFDVADASSVPSTPIGNPTIAARHASLPKTHAVFLTPRGRDGGKYAGVTQLPTDDAVDHPFESDQPTRHSISCKYTDDAAPHIRFYLYRRADCADADTCWRPLSAARKAARASAHPQEILGPVVPLAGSPKPLNTSSDSFGASELSFRRVLHAWGVLGPPVTPVMFLEPSDTVGQQLTREHSDFSVFTSFEHHKEFQTQPTYRGLFKDAFKKARTSESPAMAVYSNSDILFTSSLAESLAASFAFAAKWQAGGKVKLLVVGMRINTDMPAGVDLGRGEEDLDRVLTRLAATGKRYQSNAEDYFAVSRGLCDWGAMPDFIVGGVAFDNWLVGKYNRDAGAVVVDASDTILAVHQNHGAGRKDSHLQPKSRYNRELAAKHGSWSKGRVLDARFATLSTPWGEIIVVERRKLLFD